MPPDGRPRPAADTFAYDAASRLTSASVGGVSHTYTYAGDGRRLSATDAGTTTNFVWDPNSGPAAAGPRDATRPGASLRDYTYGLGLAPLSLTAGSATSYLSTDALGSVLAMSSTGRRRSAHRHLRALRRGC